MGLPAVLSGQCYVAEFLHKDVGARAPIAVVLWASVSSETDARFRANPGQRVRLRPDEWTSGEHLWIVDMAGDPAAVTGALLELAGKQFAGKPVNLRTW